MGSSCSERININNEEEDEEMVPLPGFRFHPTDEELVGFYLRRKVENKPIALQLIKHIDIYKYDPWELPKVISSVVGDNKEWYFFCIRGRKYRNSIRPNRVTGSGFWKATGIDKPIYSSSSIIKASQKCIGLKKCLVFYRGTAGKGTKTDWMMHEFRLPLNSNTSPHNNIAEVWTLCRIFKRIPSSKRYKPVDWKQTTKKPNPSDSTSKTCSSFESENISDQQQVSFGDSSSLVQPNQRTNLLMGQFNSITHQASFPAAHQSLWNPIGDHDFFANGNWDELRTVVDLAIDPSLAYDCK